MGVAAGDCEVVVLGAGPAGATAARLLASWGHRVCLITRPVPAGETGLAESLTPSCGKFFDLLGIRDRIDAAGFVRTTGNSVWWGDEAPRIETFAHGARGWQATAPRLEAVMRAAAVDAGARCLERLLTAEEAASWPAAFRIDCSGRAGVLARSRANRQVEPGHRTVAMSAVWRAPREWALPDPSHTLLESYADGWAWSVPIDRERRAVAVMVDPQRSSLARGDGALATYLAELAKTRRFRDLLERAERVEGPAGWDASLYHATEYAGDDWLVAGDAATFIDPLSSAGVKKALASGWLAAVVTHTSLVNPSMGAAARRFFADREREMYASFLAMTRHYLHEAGGREAQPFWADRAEAREWDDRQAQAARERALIRAAHERLRAAPALRFRRSEDAWVERRAAVAGREIVMEPRLVSAADPVGTRYLHDVDVVTMVELAPAHQQVPDLYAACVNRSGPTDLAAFVTALATAVARGWLILDAEASRPEIGHEKV